MSSEHCVICGHGRPLARLWIPTPGIASPGIPSPAPEEQGYWAGICDICGHGVRLAERSFADNIAFQEDFYRSEPAPPRRRRWPERPALLAGRIRRMLGDSGSLLDIGCGPGTWLAQFDRRWRKYGVDVSDKAAAVARRATGAEVFCGPVEDYQDAPRALDLITAFALIEHLQDPRRLVEWCSEHLRPGGLLVLMTGDRESGLARAMGAAWPMYQPSEHVHFFSARSLSRLVESARLEVVRLEWRPMIYARAGDAGRTRAEELAHRARRSVERYLAKAKEVVGLLNDDRYDHLYIYARRRARA